MSRRTVCLLILFFSILLHLSLARPTHSTGSNPSIHLVSPGHSTIQEAINGADAGDTIVLAAGTYHENVVLDKALTIRGEGTKTKLVGVVESDPVVLVNATNVSVYDLSIQDAEIAILLENCSWCHVFRNTLFNNSYGIVLRECSRCTVHDNNVTANKTWGIRVENSELCDIGSRGEGALEGPNTVNDNGQWLWLDGGIELTNCFLCFVGVNNIGNNTSYGISLKQCNNTNVYAARVKDCFEGISVYSCSQCNVAATYLENNHWGVSVADSQDCSIGANGIYNSTEGITIARCWNCQIIDENCVAYSLLALIVEESSHVMISENSLLENEAGGLIGRHSNDSMVLSNVIWDTHSGPGISLESVFNWTVAYNTVGGSSEGVSVEWSTGCRIYENEMTNNTVGLAIKLYVGNCELFRNRIDNNSVGISLSYDEITFHRNILFNNTKQVENMLLNETGKGYNDWDDGEGIGNYWGDYRGFDVDGDGIGESPYVIDMKNRDYYPLIGGPGDDYRPPIITDCHITNALSHSSTQLVNPFDIVKVQATAIDQQSGIGELTLVYGIENLNCSVRMVRIGGDFFNATYEGWICPWVFHERDDRGLVCGSCNVTYRVEATDYDGNVASSENATFTTAEPSNTLNIDIVISEVHTEQELSVVLEMAIDGHLPAWMAGDLRIDASNWRESTEVNRATHVVASESGQYSSVDYGDIIQWEVNLLGESEAYPFDSYYLNLTFRLQPSQPYYVTDSYWADIYADEFALIQDSFYEWSNVTLSVNLPHYVQQGLLSTWGSPEPNLAYTHGTFNETTGFDVDFVLVRQPNNVLPLLLLIVTTTYMLGATLLADASWNPEVKTAIYLSFFVMVAGFNFALRYLIPFRYGLTVAEVLFITLTVATAVFSIGVVISSILFSRLSEDKAKKANLVIDFSAICLSVVLLAIFSVPIMLLVIEVVGLFFGFVLRVAVLDRHSRTKPRTLAPA